MTDNVAAALKQFYAQRARCLACDRKPDKLKVDVDPMGDVRLRAICHGSIDEFRLTEEDIDDGKLRKAFDWMEKLFPLDGFPDMKELLKYNREPWGFDDVR